MITAGRGDWDQPLSDSHRTEWEKWRSEIKLLHKLMARRCYKAGVSSIVESSLHCFSDACDIGYGCASYMRHVYPDGNVSLSLVMGKSRVLPLKGLTVPRTELVAATTSAKVSALIQDELYQEFPTFFWIGSKVVLGYINNSSKHFPVIVANCIQKLHSYSSVTQWKYVPSEDNPADHASRGINITDDVKVNCWLYGPEFLRCAPLPEPVETFTVNGDDLKLQKEFKANATFLSGKESMLDHLER